VECSRRREPPWTRGKASGGKVRNVSRLARPHNPLALAALAVLLCSPALDLGFQLDDYFIRAALSDPPMFPEWSRSPAHVFAFFDGDPGFNRQARSAGSVPWWTAEDLRLAFFRPLSGLTHWLDFRLWPDHPLLMHAHSLLWLGACVAVAGVLFRQLRLPGAVAGLAGLLFAVDGGHGTPAAWLANRNALVACCFALLSLLAHHRWRLGWRPGIALAPLLLLLGLLGGELAVAAGGYLLGYALFLDRGGWKARALSLVPGAAVGLGWAMAYRALGYGAKHSMLYLDPADPFAFLPALVERGPILFFGQWALPADLHGFLSIAGRRVLWSAAVAVTALVGYLLAPLLRRDAHARFFATGMLLSLVPAAATFPGDRLLVLASFGGAGLLAQWLVAMLESRGAPSNPAPGSRMARLLFWPAIAIHLGLAPLGLLGASDGVRTLGDVAARAAATLPRDDQIAGQHLVLVNAPTAFLSSQSLLVSSFSGGQMPARVHTLGSSTAPMRVRRPDAVSLVIEPRGGYLPSPGSVVRGGEDGPRFFDPSHVFPTFDRLYRGDTRLAVGQRIPLGGLHVEVLSVTPDGRPEAVAFVFDRPLDDPGYRWLQWRGEGYAPFDPPAIGAEVELPGIDVWEGGADGSGPR